MSYVIPKLDFELDEDEKDVPVLSTSPEVLDVKRLNRELVGQAGAIDGIYDERMRALEDRADIRDEAYGKSADTISRQQKATVLKGGLGLVTDLAMGWLAEDQRDKAEEKSDKIISKSVMPLTGKSRGSDMMGDSIRAFAAHKSSIAGKAGKSAMASRAANVAKTGARGAAQMHVLTQTLVKAQESINAAKRQDAAMTQAQAATLTRASAAHSAIQSQQIKGDIQSAYTGAQISKASGQRAFNKVADTMNKITAFAELALAVYSMGKMPGFGGGGPAAGGEELVSNTDTFSVPLDMA
jgi:hypothetical protein